MSLPAWHTLKQWTLGDEDHRRHAVLDGYTKAELALKRAGCERGASDDGGTEPFWAWAERVAEKVFGTTLEHDLQAATFVRNRVMHDGRVPTEAGALDAVVAFEEVWRMKRPPSPTEEPAVRMTPPPSSVAATASQPAPARPAVHVGTTRTVRQRTRAPGMETWGGFEFATASLSLAFGAAGWWCWVHALEIYEWMVPDVERWFELFFVAFNAVAEEQKKKWPGYGVLKKGFWSIVFLICLVVGVIAVAVAALLVWLAALAVKGKGVAIVLFTLATVSGLVLVRIIWCSWVRDDGVDQIE